MDADDLWTRLLAPGDVAPTWVVPALRIAAGVALVVLGGVVLVDHDAAAADLDRYALPGPSTTAWLAGVVWLVGGLGLVAGLGVRLVGGVLAVTLVVALSTGGRVDRDLVHLGVIGALVLAVGALTYLGAGRWSIDEALVARRAPARPGPGDGDGGSGAGDVDGGTGGAGAGPAGSMPAP